MNFWDKFYNQCQKHGVTPSYVGSQINISRASISAWKNENSKPSITTRTKLNEYFDLPDDFNWEDDEPQIYKPVSIPILGRVAAGIPIEQIVDIDDWEEISEELAKNGKYFALKIHGNSMEPRMCENDIIIVRQQNTVENGEIAVVSINGLDATCKKIEYTDDGISLISFNPTYAPMCFTKEQAEQLPITILGKVIELRAKM